MGGFSRTFTIAAGITVTRTTISRATGVFTLSTETHSLAGVQASVAEYGGQYSHRTFSRSAGGALVGGMVGAPLLGAALAPHKKVDNRSLQVTITGPAFCWTFTANADFPPHHKVAELNDRAAKYTADPRGVELTLMIEDHQAAQGGPVRELAKVQRKLAALVVDNQRDRSAIDRLMSKVAEAHTAGKVSRGDRKNAAADHRRQTLAARLPEKIDPLRRERQSISSRLDVLDQNTIARCRSEVRQLHQVGDHAAANAREAFAAHLWGQMQLRATQLGAAEQESDTDAAANASYITPPRLPAQPNRPALAPAPFPPSQPDNDHRWARVPPGADAPGYPHALGAIPAPKAPPQQHRLELADKDSDDVGRLVELEVRAATLRAEGKIVRADVAWGEAVRLRSKLAASVGEATLPPVAEGARKLSWSEIRDRDDGKEIQKLITQAADARAAGKVGKAERLEATAHSRRNSMAKRAAKPANTRQVNCGNLSQPESDGEGSEAQP